jgi:hypothetical protein
LHPGGCRQGDNRPRAAHRRRRCPAYRATLSSGHIAHRAPGEKPLGWTPPCEPPDHPEASADCDVPKKAGVVAAQPEIPRRRRSNGSQTIFKPPAECSKVSIRTSQGSGPAFPWRTCRTVERGGSTAAKPPRQGGRTRCPQEDRGRLFQYRPPPGS